jgi:hypothetical protein
MVQEIDEVRHSFKLDSRYAELRETMDVLIKQQAGICKNEKSFSSIQWLSWHVYQGKIIQISEEMIFLKSLLENESKGEEEKKDA